MSDDGDPNARKDDPETSKKAGADIRKETAADRAEVYATFFGLYPTPLADFQMEKELGGSMNGKWRKRRCDLTDEGVLVAVDKIVNPNTNREVIRWGLRCDPSEFGSRLRTLSVSGVPCMGCAKCNRGGIYHFFGQWYCHEHRPDAHQASGL